MEGAATIVEADRVAYGQFGRGRRRDRWRQGRRQHDAGTAQPLLQRGANLFGVAIVVQAVEQRIVGRVVHGAASAEPACGVQGVGVLVAAGVGEQAQRRQGAAKVAALLDLAVALPALPAQLAGDHAGAVGDQVGLA